MAWWMLPDAARPSDVSPARAGAVPRLIWRGHHGPPQGVQVYRDSLGGMTGGGIALVPTRLKADHPRSRLRAERPPRSPVGHGGARGGTPKWSAALIREGSCGELGEAA